VSFQSHVCVVQPGVRVNGVINAGGEVVMSEVIQGLL
jgi:hypothetical protein